MAKFLKRNGSENKDFPVGKLISFLIVLALGGSILLFVSLNFNAIRFVLFHSNEVRYCRETYEAYHDKADKQFSDTLKSVPQETPSALPEAEEEGKE